MAQPTNSPPATPQNKALSSEIQNRLRSLQSSAQDFVAIVSHLDINYESRLSEIAALEMRRDKLKDEIANVQQTANQILQDAQKSSQETQERAKSIMDEVKAAQATLMKDAEKYRSLKIEAESLMKVAVDKQKEADNTYRIVEERKKKIEAALH